MLNSCVVKGKKIRNSSFSHRVLIVQVHSHIRMPGGGRAVIAMCVTLRKKNGTKAHKQNGTKTNVRVLGLVQQEFSAHCFTETLTCVCVFCVC